MNMEVTKTISRNIGWWCTNRPWFESPRTLSDAQKVMLALIVQKYNDTLKQHTNDQRFSMRVGLTYDDDVVTRFFVAAFDQTSVQVSVLISKSTPQQFILKFSRNNMLSWPTIVLKP